MLTLIDSFRTEDLWGGFATDLVKANDPLLNARNLRGKNIFISAASGWWPGTLGALVADPVNIVVGVPLEIYSRWTVEFLVDRLRSEGIPVTDFYAPIGVHDWTTWDEALVRAKPQIDTTMG